MDAPIVQVLFNVELQQHYICVRVDIDKNVDNRREVYAYIPEYVPSLGVQPVQLLNAYLSALRPPVRRLPAGSPAYAVLRGCQLHVFSQPVHELQHRLQGGLRSCMARPVYTLV